MSSFSRDSVESQSVSPKTVKGPVVVAGTPAFSESPPRKPVSANEGPPEVWRFAGICIQLVLVLLAMFLYEIESARGFHLLLPLIFVGFIVNAWLPLQFRMPFFTLVSAASVVLILGPVNSVRLFAIGLLLIGICHLPLPLLARVVLLGLVGGVLAALHAGQIETTWAAAVLPILAAMFMFRLAIYLYDIRNEKQPVGISARLAYFFMLPNACFPLFPVVDYRAFLRSHYQKPALDTYQVGVQWMLRGVVHLLLYRIIYQSFTATPQTVEGLNDVLLYMLTTYLLYLRISGLFHLIVGVLCLFGFSLPETHHLYYLASSFNDFWRRINIYWKDFMMKLFYYPVLTRVKHLGTIQSMSIATVVVFFGTWILHAYQWFWLRGTFPITVVDSLFWAILGVLVVINSIYQVKHPKKASLGKPKWSWSNAFIHSAKVVGMFCFITALWAMWSSASLSDYLLLLRVGAGGSAAEFAGFFAILALALFAGVAYQFVQYHGWSVFRGNAKPLLLRPPMMTATVAILLTILYLPEVDGLVGPDASRILMSARDNKLNARDAEMLERGYYEGLLAAGHWGSQVWEKQVERRPEDWGAFWDSDAAYEIGGVTGYALKPSYESVEKRVVIRSNQWGMRDREYTKEKPEGVYRVALLGASYEMGHAVEQDSVFKFVAEEILNEELAGDDAPKIEILNFAVTGYGIIQFVEQAREFIWEFDPDVVFVAAHTADLWRSSGFIARAVRNEVPLPPELQEIATAAGLRPDMTVAELQRKLHRKRLIGGDSYAHDLYEWGYQEIAKICRERGVTPVWLFVPRSESAQRAGDKSDQQEMAQAAGFHILDLDGTFDKVEDLEKIQVAPWDTHPNEEGHRMLGQRLAEVMLENRAKLGF